MRYLTINLEMENHMKGMFSFIAMSCVFCMEVADTSVWHGKVNSDGTPTPSVKLNLGEKYKIKVSGKINLEKWRTGGKALENDACFEFFAIPRYQEIPPKKIGALKNSLNLNVCDEKYQQDHIYESKAFTAMQSGIHFWIYDTDYEDNSGELDLEVIQVNSETAKEEQ